jgi:hypothetical protein
MLEMSTVSYKKRAHQLVLSVAKKNKDEDLSSVFCSELVAATLKSMDLYHPEENSTNVTPKDFYSLTYQKRIHILHRDKEDFPLEKGASFDPEYRIILNEENYMDHLASKIQTDPATLSPK